jgi:hypothetical protein
MTPRDGVTLYSVSSADPSFHFSKSGHGQVMDRWSGGYARVRPGPGSENDMLTNTVVIPAYMAATRRAAAGRRRLFGQRADHARIRLCACRVVRPGQSRRAAAELFGHPDRACAAYPADPGRIGGEPEQSLAAAEYAFTAARTQRSRQFIQRGA